MVQRVLMALMMVLAAAEEATNEYWCGEDTDEDILGCLVAHCRPSLCELLA